MALHRMQPLHSDFQQLVVELHRVWPLLLDLLKQEVALHRAWPLVLNDRLQRDEYNNQLGSPSLLCVCKQYLNHRAEAFSSFQRQQGVALCRAEPLCILQRSHPGPVIDDSDKQMTL